MFDVHMTADTRPDPLQSNPSYGVALRQDTNRETNIGAVTMQSNPAYGAIIRGQTMQSDSETS